MGNIDSIKTVLDDCMQSYRNVSSTSDCKGRFAQFQVEHSRLVRWRQTTGLDGATDGRFSQPAFRNSVHRELTAIQQTFDNVEQLQNQYGLQAILVAATTPSTSTFTSTHTKSSSSSNVFKRAFGKVRKSSSSNHTSQQQQPPPNKVTWKVGDWDKFDKLVAQLRSCNDRLYYTIQTGPQAGSQVTNNANATTLQARFGEHEAQQLEVKLQQVEDLVDKQSAGAMIPQVYGPIMDKAKVYSNVIWAGRERERVTLYKSDLVYVSTAHDAFAAYKKTKFMKPQHHNGRLREEDEDIILLDVESWSHHESIHPGTVTVEGFALECWEYEETKPRLSTTLISRIDLPQMTPDSVLRRLDQLQKGRVFFGVDPFKDQLHLIDFAGDLKNQLGRIDRQDPLHWTPLIDVMNRRDVFVNFLETSSVCIQLEHPQCEVEGVGMWEVLGQLILAQELALRLKKYGAPSNGTSFTPRALASLIVSDLWVENVQMVLGDPPSKADTEETAAKPETAAVQELKAKGDQAFQKKNFLLARDLFSQAINQDPENSSCYLRRSTVRLALGNMDGAWYDCRHAMLYSPRNSDVWRQWGQLCLRNTQPKQAQMAFEKALKFINTSGHVPATSTKQAEEIREGLRRAQKEQVELGRKRDPETKHKLECDALDAEWDMSERGYKILSRVHVRQVEGLLLFAERMKWPYLDDLRDCAEELYSRYLVSDTTVELRLNCDQFDWIFGLVLPGKRFAFKIMAAMVSCTPSIAKETKTADNYYSGLAIPNRVSYWRLRTVLASVLGGLPGIHSLCGWIGPCPLVQFDPSPAPGPGPDIPRHITIQARQIALTKPQTAGESTVIQSYNPHKAMMSKPPGLDVWSNIAEILDENQWVVVDPPRTDYTTYELQKIVLNPVPSPTVASQDETEEIQCRASITFQMTPADPARPSCQVTYKLFANPVFITVPQCYPEQGGSHRMHTRSLPLLKRNVCLASELKDHATTETGIGSSDFEGDGVLIINATGKGAEVLARAWCAERGKCAVVCRGNKTCFVCAVHAANSLNTGVLIWVG